MGEDLKTETATETPQSHADNEDKLSDILKAEYTSLLGLYTHTEDALSSVFNFYLTLLSAIAGAMIVLVQVNSANVAASLPSISALLAFAILIGVISQDSIVNKNIDLANYALGLNLLKYRLFRKWPEELAYVFYLHNFWAKVNPLQPKRIHTSDRIHKRLWWLFPLGTHQLFIGVINSLALASLVIIVAQLLSGNAIPVERLSIGGVLMVVISFEIHAIYARTKHKRGVENLVTSAGTEVKWS